MEEKVRLLEKSMSEASREFHNALASLREDVDKLSEKKEEKLGKDISEVEEEIDEKIQGIVNSLNNMKDNVDKTVSALRVEMRKGDAIRKDELNRTVKEFFGIRARMEERMKQLTEQFTQLDKFKQDFKKSFDSRLASSEVAVKRLEESLSKMESEMNAIAKMGAVNEDKLDGMKKDLRERLKNLEGRVESLSKGIKTIKKESVEELDKLIEEAED